MDRNEIANVIGREMERAARASVAKGAFYAPGEHISMDSETAWRMVATGLVNMVDIMLREKGLPAKAGDINVERLSEGV